MLAKIGKKYQLTIPKAVWSSLNIGRGDTLYGTFIDGALVLGLTRPEDSETESLTITVRDRYQITLPAKTFRALGVREGHVVELELQEDFQFAIYPEVIFSRHAPRLRSLPVVNPDAFRPTALAELSERPKKRKPRT